MRQYRATNALTDALETFTESQIPEWLLGAEYVWFYRTHICSMKIGATAVSEPWSIVRLNDENSE